ncbi:DUF3168 domain-containing protein [Pukyongiella litopenaei]|uniref:DUF3168 domain-containing protein n=1 Tax=Pukyongiella litopenaei TaxID=2605946 RepID=A0A2S0ML39_9RHOB|nr:DUF3168 domain-containing protein [Pukyongiella litopenaei]AVO36600.1 DUF3168 domain-containing protein [Pukyongiella litopenaei]
MSVSAELQKAIYDTLVADAGVAALIGDRIYDGRPETSAFPCITFGPSDSDPEDMECVNARTETVQLDVWARDQGRMRPGKEIMDAVRDALHLADLSLTVNALVLIRVEGMRLFMDTDGVTAHGVITVQADVEQA